MQHNFTYACALGLSQRANWRVEDIIGGDKQLDFTLHFMPEENVTRALPVEVAIDAYQGPHRPCSAGFRRAQAAVHAQDSPPFHIPV